jgi:hypothetical protein
MAKSKRKKKPLSKKRPLKRSVVDDNGKARLNLMIDADLKDWAHDYGRRKGKSLSAMVVGYFVELREEDEAPDVPQI